VDQNQQVQNGNPGVFDLNVDPDDDPEEFEELDDFEPVDDQVYMEEAQNDGLESMQLSFCNN
jgi:hypothetical protein